MWILFVRVFGIIARKSIWRRKWRSMFHNWFQDVGKSVVINRLIRPMNNNYLIFFNNTIIYNIFFWFVVLETSCVKKFINNFVVLRNQFIFFWKQIVILFDIIASRTNLEVIWLAIWSPITIKYKTHNLIDFKTFPQENTSRKTLS